MSTVIAYKVVAVIGQDMMSAVVFDCPVACVYREYEWVHASELLLDKGLGLSVFASTESAQAFTLTLNKDAVREIWRCECEPLSNPSSVRDSCAAGNLFGMTRSEFEQACHLIWPSGTILCKRVKLTERIESI